MANNLYQPSSMSQMSHELRIPLTGILGMAEMLSHGPLTSQQQVCLEGIQQAGNQLLVAVNTLLKTKQKTSLKKPTSATQLTVLLVEDDPIVQKVHHLMLKKIGYHVDIAESGQQALQLYKKNKYGLILMDIGLPDVSGIDIVAAIRKQEKINAQVKIIVLTAYIQEETKNACLAAGVDTVITKPIMFDELQELLRQTL